MNPVANAGPDQSVIDTDGDGSETVALQGSGSDDGTIVSYQWTEGTTILGNDATITPTLNVGTHVLTLTVTDNEGAIDTDTVEVIVSKPNQTGTIYVADLDATASPGFRGKFVATVTITVVNSLAQPMPNVSITGFLRDDPSTPITIITDQNGQATITRSNINKNQSSLSFTVSSLSLEGYVYDPNQNQDPDEDSDGTVIVAYKPSIKVLSTDHEVVDSALPAGLPAGWCFLQTQSPEGTTATADPC